jgi:hypothetical protein
MGSGVVGGLAVELVAAALFFIGVILCFAAKAFIEKATDIWKELGPLLEHEMLMRRIEVRLMIDDAGFEIPDWLNDDEDEDDEKVIQLVPKQEEE